MNWEGDEKHELKSKARQSGQDPSSKMEIRRVKYGLLLDRTHTQPVDDAAAVSEMIRQLKKM
jgi:hypothetical protein